MIKRKNSGPNSREAQFKRTMQLKNTTKVYIFTRGLQQVEKYYSTLKTSTDVTTSLRDLTNYKQKC